MSGADASGDGFRHRKNHGTARVVVPIAILVLAVLAVAVAISVRTYKSTPSFSVSQLRKAFTNNDPDAVLQYFDVDAVVDHFLRNANKQDPEVAAFSAAMKDRLRDGLKAAAGGEVGRNQIRGELAGSMAAKPSVDRKGVGVARVSFPGETFSLLMKSSVGDRRWRIVGIEGADLEKWASILGLNAPEGVLKNLPPAQKRDLIR